MTTCRIFTLTVGIKNPFQGFEDINQQIFPAKFHKNLMLQMGADLISVSIRSDFHETLKERSNDEYFQIYGRNY